MKKIMEKTEKHNTLSTRDEQDISKKYDIYVTIRWENLNVCLKPSQFSLPHSKILTCFLNTMHVDVMVQSTRYNCYLTLSVSVYNAGDLWSCRLG